MTPPTSNQAARRSPQPEPWQGVAPDHLAKAIEQLERANAEMRVAEERGRVAASIARMFTWDLDCDTLLITRSPLPQAVLAFDIPADLDGMAAMVHADDRVRWRASVERSMTLGEALDEDFRLVPPDGPPLWVRSCGIRQGTRLIGVTQDITQRKQAEQRRAQMFAELQHRVKNMLAVVRSISTRTLETASSLEAYAAHFGGRLDALARTQSALARRGADGVELEDVIQDELAASAARDGEQVTVAGPRVVLKAKAVEVFAMALHELATNAVKYGALSTAEGRVAIEWRLADRSEGRVLAFSWRERGVAALDTRPSRLGFGRDLMERGLPYDLGAVTTLRFAPGGVQFSLELPLSERVCAGGEGDGA